MEGLYASWPTASTRKFANEVRQPEVRQPLLFRTDDGIVVVEGSGEDGTMQNKLVPLALRERLGPDATAGFVEAIEAARREWRDDVIDVCSASFERRLGEETLRLRVEMAGLRADLRQEMAQLSANLRQEMSGLGADLRQEMTELRANLRQEMAQLGAALREEIADGRFELLKWCFLFWLGQVVAVSGILALMLRAVR
jgi:hypothetical protein